LKRAILLFARTPVTEAANKPLSHRFSPKQRLRYFESLNQHILAKLDSFGCPIVVATDDSSHRFGNTRNFAATVIEQRGKLFGERLSNALRDMFSMGYEQVVCVGNDCLELSATDIESAFHALNSTSSVLGAASDGGAYLIGVRRDYQHDIAKAFAACRWETPHLFSDLLQALRLQQCSVTLLHVRSDIDSEADLLFNSRRLPHLQFLREAATIISAFHSHYTSVQNNFLPSLHPERLRYQKAPPLI
jgi:glycosyltransferase A (GT-A) superfamily protein (DUF2064 family)